MALLMLVGAEKVLNMDKDQVTEVVQPTDLIRSAGVFSSIVASFGE